MWLGVLFLLGGLVCHVLAADAIGGSAVAYRDHLLGFVGLTVVSGAILGVLGWRFWRGRRDITIFALGLLQALIGLFVYTQRFAVHG